MKLLLLLGLFFFASCKLYLKAVYGIKKPRVESTTSIRRAAAKSGMSDSLLIGIDTGFFLSTFKRVKSLPEAEIFNAAGENILYKKESESCSAPLSVFLQRLTSGGKYEIGKGKHLSEAKAGLCDLNGNPLPAAKLAPADFYIFIYWAKWLGKLNKETVEEWQRMASECKQARIAIYEVNMDLRDWWPESFRDKINFSTK